MSISPRPPSPSRLRGSSQSRLYFLPSSPFFLSCSGPDSQVLDVLDDCGEGLPVSLVEHVLVDGRKASMIVLAHLVVVNHSVGRSDEGCFRFAPLCGNEKKNAISGPETGVCRFIYSRSQLLSVGTLAFQAHSLRKNSGGFRCVEYVVMRLLERM